MSTSEISSALPEGEVTHAARVQPATALPWQSVPCENILGDRLGRAYTLCDEAANELAIFRVDGSRRQQRDSEYAAHSANAYPRLAAALIEAAQQLDYLRDKYPPTSSGEAVLSRTNGLLRELGELP